MPLVYEDLRRLSQYYLQDERPGHTLQSTAIAKELYLRLCGQRLCCKFENPQKMRSARRGYFDLLGDESEQLSDEPDLTPNVVSLHPPNLPLPHHVYCFTALNGSSGRVKFPEALLVVDPTFHRAMVLLEDVVQVLDGSMTTAAW